MPMGHRSSRVLWNTARSEMVAGASKSAHLRAIRVCLLSRSAGFLATSTATEQWTAPQTSLYSETSSAQPSRWATPWTSTKMGRLMVLPTSLSSEADLVQQFEIQQRKPDHA